MKVLDLFSGIGGFSLGLERAGMETVAFCEYDEKARLVLKKHWPEVPIYNDVRELNGRQFEGQSIDLICGGFPCQPYSVAGDRLGEKDDRHLWPEYFRLIQEIRPTWIIGENVFGIINLFIDSVLSDLESAGYRHETLIIPACAVNAPHRRERVWIVAHSAGIGLQGSRLTGNSHGSSRKNGGTHQSTGTGSTDGEWPVGDPKLHGLFAPEEQGGDKTPPEGSQKGQESTLKSEGAGGRKHNEDVAHAKGGKSGVKKTGDGRESFVGGSKEESSNVAYPVSGSKGSSHRSRASRIADKKQNNGNQLRNDSGNSSQDMAHTDKKRLQGIGADKHPQGRQGQEEGSSGLCGGGMVPDTHGSRKTSSGDAGGVGRQWEQISHAGEYVGENWRIEPSVGRVAHGVPKRMDRLKQLGNAVIPQIPELIGRAIMAVEAQPCK